MQVEQRNGKIDDLAADSKEWRGCVGPGEKIICSMWCMGNMLGFFIKYSLTRA